MMNTIPSLRSPPTGDTSVLQHPSLRQFCFHSLTKEWISSTQQKKSFKKLQGWEREKIGNKENWNERERKKERARETFFMTSVAVGHGREQCKEMLDHLALQRTH